MKSPRCFLLGLVASLLLSAGFVQAAEMADRLGGVVPEPFSVHERGAPNCVVPCSWTDR